MGRHDLHDVFWTGEEKVALPEPSPDACRQCHNLELDRHSFVNLAQRGNTLDTRRNIPIDSVLASLPFPFMFGKAVKYRHLFFFFPLYICEPRSLLLQTSRREMTLYEIYTTREPRYHSDKKGLEFPAFFSDQITFSVFRPNHCFIVFLFAFCVSLVYRFLRR